ncbi:MAG TPA: site-2 protease family protein [Acidimicrobiales bacterium]|nr:site-2 protease family protein [Acidimicrobiales bacterium]
MSNPWGAAPQGPQRGQGPNPRTVAWVIAGIAVVVVLVRTHHLTAVEFMYFGALVPSVILHEVSHGAMAQAFGDDTAKRAGRLTLNPVKHIDPFGTIILPILLVLSGHGVIGWAKPVPVNVSRLRHPRNEGVVVSLVGPGVNILLAAVLALVYRAVATGTDKEFLRLGALAGPTWLNFVFIAGLVNVFLAVFNLIPLPPLDGSAVIERLLPARLLPGYYRIRPFTLVIPLIIVVLFPSVLDRIFNPAFNLWASAVGA